MRVRILTNADNAHLRRIESAVSLINGSQHYFHLTFQPNASILRRNAAVNPEAICSDAEARWPHEHLIVITEDPLDDNWFSHEYRMSAVITTADWEAFFAPPSLRTFLMYQIAQGLLHFAADLSQEMAMNFVHEPPVGCVYDWSLNKPDIRLGMVAGNVCHKCVGQLRALGTDDAAVESVIRIVSLVRAEALGRPVVFDPSEVFVVMRFTSNDENDNAWKYGIKKGIEATGLKAVRGDERVESGQILEKINRLIQRSRLIVAKVDENNLNVFYELGIAMGLDKDVLLVSESSLVLNLPSDLKNWECLMYQRGNYEQLANAVCEFICHRYGIVANDAR